MVITDKDYGDFDVSLGDDGTMDTVVVVSPVALKMSPVLLTCNGASQEIRYSTEYGAMFRDDDGAMTDEGFKELAEESVDAYIDQYLI